jgi:hypothetical protein
MSGANKPLVVEGGYNVTSKKMGMNVNSGVMVPLTKHRSQRGGNEEPGGAPNEVMEEELMEEAEEAEESTMNIEAAEIEEAAMPVEAEGGQVNQNGGRKSKSNRKSKSKKSKKLTKNKRKSRKSKTRKSKTRR